MSHLTPYLAVFAVSSKKWITSCQVDSYRLGLHTKKRGYVSKGANNMFIINWQTKDQLTLRLLTNNRLTDRNPYNLRNANNIQLIHSRTTSYYNSFLSSSIRLWNDLPSDIRNNTSINSFKTYLNRNTTCKSFVFLRWPKISNITYSSSSEMQES